MDGLETTITNGSHNLLNWLFQLKYKMVEINVYQWVNATKKNMVTSDSNNNFFFLVVVTGPFLQ